MVSQASTAPGSRPDFLHLALLLGTFASYEQGATLGGDWRWGLIFHLTYAAWWMGVLLAVDGGSQRRWAMRSCRFVTFGLALWVTVFYQYQRVTGSPLDWAYLLHWASDTAGTSAVIWSGVNARVGLLLAAITGWVAFGASFTARVLGPRLGIVERRAAGWIVWRPRLLASALMGTAFFGFCLQAVHGVSAVQLDAREAAEWALQTTAEGVPPSDGRLVPSDRSDRRNIVVVFLESTRADATTPYNPSLQTTPFLSELAAQSLLVRRAYPVVPHTHNAIVATLCGTDPPLDPRRTRQLSQPGVVRGSCLGHLVSQLGYTTAYFMSHTKTFEDSEGILANLGIADFHSIESLNTSGFEETNYFGYEDEVLLAPSLAWLLRVGAQPFLTVYLTSAPHHDYRAPSGRYGRVAFDDSDERNRYLNSVRLQDFFLRELFEQYKALGLYEKTIFVVIGDHGEAFGEHGRFQHDQVIWEEGLRIPLLIHDPKRFREGGTVDGPASQLDVLPTIADLLGYRLEGGAYGGVSLLSTLPENRTLMFSCFAQRSCVASLHGSLKYVFHFDGMPEELFDLTPDPLERTNVATQHDPETLAALRHDLLEWRARVQTGWSRTTP